jgi:gamma-glutamylputrescine oxidase
MQLSYWEYDRYFKRNDVVIVGAGIVGLNAAIHLKKVAKHLNVLIVERGFLPYGASTPKCWVCLFWKCIRNIGRYTIYRRGNGF